MTFLLLQSGPCPPAFNMALDEALLEAMPRRGKPVLRFYGWTEPAASFGYFQRFADVEHATLLRPLVRRPTGGGIVSHDADWTYSLAFPTTHEWYSLAAIDSYRRVHEWIQAAFARLNVATELADGCRRAGPGQCFVGHEKFDLLWRGKKIAGAAQRRTRAGLLIQGSIQPPPLALVRADWEQAMRAVAERQAVGVHALACSPEKLKLEFQPLRAGSEAGARSEMPRSQWVEHQLDTALRERAEELAERKYSQAAFTRKR